MDVHEIDSRFGEAAHMLHVVWGAAELTKHAKVLEVASDMLDDGQFPPPSRALREHLRSCSTKAIMELDRLLNEVPYTEHSRLRYMELLAGSPTAWGAPVDITRRSIEHTHLLRWLVLTNPDNLDMLHSEVEYYQGPEAAKAQIDLIHRIDAVRWEVVRNDVQFEVLRVFQHFHDAGIVWSKAPAAPLTFKEHFGERNLKLILAAMQSAEIAPRAAKGKNEVVAALHAACVRFEKNVPRPSHWPSMLEELFPGTRWTAKSVPQHAKHRTDSYREAYATMLDRLG
jgi:hypothetical protein